MRTRPLWLILLSLLLLVAVSATGACGNSGAPSHVQSGGTLTLYDIAPPTLDPAMALSETSLTYIVEIFSGLVSYDPDLRLTGDIASSWDVSGDGLTYTFHLRESVVFHDGTPLTAADFKYSMERACDPSTGSATAATFLGDIVGAQEKLAGEADTVSGVTVIDEHTLEITIDAPKEYFLAKLAHPAAFAVDRNNVESGADWWRNPNGTGPFRLTEWVQDELMVLERNGSYYLTPPLVDEVEYLLWGGVPMMLYERGEIDFTGVSLGDIERVLDPASPLNRELEIIPELGLGLVGFNSTRPPFDDPDVRRAFSHAIDKEKIVDLTLKGVLQLAEGILPPGMPGYDESIQGLAYDPELARRLLAESEYGGADGLPPITLTSPGRGYVSGVEQALVDMWRRNLGVEVRIRQLEPERYPHLVRDEKDEMFTLGWGADYLDPQGFLDVLFHSGAEQNIGEYNSPLADELLERARVERDFSARMALYQEAEQVIVEDAACLPLYFGVTYALVKPYVKDLPLPPLWIPRLRYVHIERS